MRRLAAVFALIFLVVSPALAGAADYNDFLKAYDKRDYTKAAKIAITLNSTSASITTLERYATACEYAGRIPEAVGFRVERLYRDAFHGSVTSTLVFDEARSIARMAAQGKVQPEDEIVAALTLVEAGDTLAGAQKLHERYHRSGYGMRRMLCLDALVAHVFPAIESAVQRGDKTQAAELARCRSPWPAPPRYKRSVLDALEMGGDVAGAVKQAYDDVFSGQNEVGPYDMSGNPTLLPIAAEIAHRHQHISDIPLVAAYAKHLAGDTKGAVGALERIAGSSSTNPTDDTLCVARFLAGDLCRQQGDLRKALSWYHLVTWSDFEHWDRRYMSPATARDAGHPLRMNAFHRILGSVRQAQVLLAQGRPKLALEELGTLVDLDPELRERVNQNTTLASEWKAAADTLAAHVAAASGDGRMGETLDSLGYYANDWVLDARGKPIPRRPARTILEQVVAQHETRREWMTDQRTSEGLSNFMKSYQEAQAEAEAAKRAAEAPSSSARLEAFQFKQQVRSSACIRCKGTGSLYVPPNERQGWTYSEVTKQVMDTMVHTSAHMVQCHWCNGTGKR